MFYFPWHRHKLERDQQRLVSHTCKISNVESQGFTPNNKHARSGDRTPNGVVSSGCVNHYYRASRAAVSIHIALVTDYILEIDMSTLCRVSAASSIHSLPFMFFYLFLDIPRVSFWMDSMVFDRKVIARFQVGPYMFTWTRLPVSKYVRFPQQVIFWRPAILVQCGLQL